MGVSQSVLELLETDAEVKQCTEQFCRQRQHNPHAALVHPPSDATHAPRAPPAAPRSLAPALVRFAVACAVTTRQVAAIHKVFKIGDKEVHASTAPRTTRASHIPIAHEHTPAAERSPNSHFGSGQITSNEFHELFVTDASSPFLHHLFDVIDVNHDQSLTFSEFMAVICTFCCYTELQMVKFAFDTFDVDGSGAIGIRELSDFIAKLDTKTGDIPKTVKRVLTMFDSNADQSIGLDEFAEMNLKYPHLLWPAFRLQYRIQELTMGLNQWKGAQKRMKDKKDAVEGVAAARAGCFGCFGAKQQRTVSRNSSRSQSRTQESGATTPSRHGEVRKLNPDRIRRQKSTASGKTLSVMKGRGRSTHSQSSCERSVTSHTSRTSHTQHTLPSAVGHRRNTTASSTGGTKRLRRNLTHATVTRGHSSTDSDHQHPAGTRGGWASQSITDTRRDRAGTAPRSLPAAPSHEAMDDADTSAQSEDDGEPDDEPARVIPRKGPSNRAGTFGTRKSSSVHPFDAGGDGGGGEGPGVVAVSPSGGGGEKGNVSRRSSAVVLRRATSDSPPKGSPMGKDSASHKPLHIAKPSSIRE